MLVLNAGHVVSSARLIEGVWGEEAPETAATALQGHVSQLRRVLGSDRIVTQAPGYRLDCTDDAIDVRRFERLLENGREALARGEPEAALAALDEARSLWRGAPLDDLREAPFAAAAGPLEALGDEARDERAEAELALGRHESLVPALRDRVREDPLRERPRRQLMTALHRAGRRSEALEVYEDGRRALSEELGIEPGAPLRSLHEQILRDDTPVPAAVAVGRPVGATRRWPLVAGVVVAAAAAVAALLLTRGDSAHRAAPALRDAGVLRIDADDLDVVAATSLGGTPTSVAAGRGRVWVIDGDDQTVTELTDTGRPRRTFATGATPADLAVAPDGLWLAEGRPRGTQTLAPQATSAAHLAGPLLAVQARVRLPAAAGEAPETVDQRVAVSAAAAWVIAADGRLARIPTGADRVDHLFDLGARAVASDGEQTWVLTAGGTLVPVFADRPTTGVPVDVAPGARLLAVGGGTVWLLDPDLGRVTRVDPDRPELSRTVDLGPGASAIAYGAGAAWVADAAGGRVLRLDGRTGAPDGKVELGAVPRDIAVSGDGVWVSATPRSTPVAAGCTSRGSGDVLLVADLPLRRDPRSPTAEMAAAIQTAIDRRHGRAGTHHVALAVCDDSTAQSASYDPEKCAANARGYAHDERVVAVVGPYNSGCAERQIPIAAAAPGGPLALVSPSATDPLLRGRGTFFRVLATDADQARAMAAELARRGVARVFALDDGGRSGSYGMTVASFFASAATDRRIDVTGRASWPRRNPESLAARVLRSGADAAYVSGGLDRGAAPVIRALARRGIRLAGPDLVLPVAGLMAATHGAARGMLLSTTMLPRPAANPAPGYAARATRVVLDAIAASDGTRASVARAVRRHFAAHPSAPVAIQVVRRGGGSQERLATEGAELLRVRR